MLQWLRNRLWERRRLLFKYHDGVRTRRIDPTVAALALHEHPTFLHRHMKDAANGDREAQQIVAKAATDVFGIPEYDGKKGLTIAERIEVVLAFDLYLLALKKNTVHSLTSAPSMAST